MALLLFTLGLLGVPVGIVLLIIGLVKKRSFKGGMVIGVSFISLIIGFIMYTPSEQAEGQKENDAVETTSGKLNAESEEEKVAREKKEAEEKALVEQKAKEEAEATAKAEEEAKIKAEADAKIKAAAEKKEAEAKKTNAQTIEYPQLKKNPDRYKGEYVKYTGEIAQILEGDNISHIRLAVTKSSYGYDMNDIIFVEYAGYTDFVDKDIVTVYGEIYGSYSYESQAGYSITLPGLIADTIE